MNASIATRPATRPVPAPALAAYAAAATFAVLMVMFGGVLPAFGAHPPFALVLLVGIDAIAFHLLLFPVVAALPAPEWGRAAGYGWLVIDIVTNVMAINGVTDAGTTAMRLGGHIAAVTWVASAAWPARGWTRAVGFALALVLGTYSFWGQFQPPAAIMPAMLLMLAWVVLAARRLHTA
jgi:hypothetical protein